MKTLKDIALEMTEIQYKKMDLKSIIKKNELENQILTIIHDNIHKLVFNYNEHGVEPIFSFEVPDKQVFESLEDETVWQNAIVLMATELSERMKKEGISIDIARTGNVIKITMNNYVNEKLLKEVKKETTSMKEILKREHFDNFSKRMVIHSAKNEIQKAYDLEKYEWKRVPKHQMLEDLLEFLYKTFIHQENADKNQHNTEDSVKMIHLLKHHKFGKYSIMEAIDLCLLEELKNE